MDWRHNVEDAQSLVALFARLGDMPQPFNVKVAPGMAKKHTISQSGLYHAWIGQIAKHTHDDPDNVKAACHIQWGIPIFRAEDPDYSDFIDSALGGHTRATVVKMIKKGFVPCVRIMTKPILSKYMDAVWREYAPHVQLMDPQDLKWREAA